MLRRVATFLFAAATWYLITWPYDFATGEFNIEISAAGLVVALIASIILGRVFAPVKHAHNILYRLFWAVLYLPILFFYIIIANLDVLYRIIHPKRPINPGIVKVKTSLKSASARTALANSITLTPGTLTVDMKENGVMYIHCINVHTEDLKQATQKITVRFEKILAKVFD
ncbi:MAG: Na+/H+ antiporter subunit E [Spirochaetales bacterium]|nr:Na+/H+ antiporter subunit E [Spirochaetales bacterium]